MDRVVILRSCKDPRCFLHRACDSGNNRRCTQSTMALPCGVSTWQSYSCI